MPTTHSANIRRTVTGLAATGAFMAASIFAAAPALASAHAANASRRAHPVTASPSSIRSHRAAAEKAARRKQAEKAARRKHAEKVRAANEARATRRQTAAAKSKVTAPAKKKTKSPTTTTETRTPAATTTATLTAATALSTTATAPPAIATALSTITTASTTTTATTTAPGTDPLTTIGLTSAAPTEADPSGATVPTGNLPGWNQVYSDDFSTSVPVGGFSNCNPGPTIMTSDCSGLPAAVQSQLFAYPDGWKDTSGNGTYSPSQVLSIHDHMLDYNIHTSNGVHMVAAVVPKIPGGVNNNGLQYGAYAIRFKSDLLSGYKTAFMLWPDSEVWPQDGEIDFPEGNLDGTIGAFMHQMGATSGSQQDAYSTSATYASWHTAVIEWTPHVCKFILDGQVVGDSVSLIPNTPMHWILQAETALSGAAPADNVSGHIDIAWITAYAQAA